MKKNLYYRTMIKRQSILTEYILSFFAYFASPARLLLEVFIRKDFGERYFRLSHAVLVTFTLAVFPFVIGFFARVWSSPAVFFDGQDPEGPMVPGLSWTPYLTWYIFLVLFMGASLRHHRQRKRSGSAFDFSKYSLYSGKIHPFFSKLPWPSQEPDRRIVETILEPAPFLVVGVVLWLIQQKLGILLSFCSLIYAFSYMAAYRLGDNFILDKIDEMICNEELEKAFVEDAEEEETRGFRVLGRKPSDPETRRKLLPLLQGNDEVIEAK